MHRAGTVHSTTWRREPQICGARPAYGAGAKEATGVTRGKFRNLWVESEVEQDTRNQSEIAAVRTSPDRPAGFGTESGHLHQTPREPPCPLPRRPGVRAARAAFPADE